MRTGQGLEAVTRASLHGVARPLVIAGRLGIEGSAEGAVFAPGCEVWGCSRALPGMGSAAYRHGVSVFLSAEVKRAHCMPPPVSPKPPPPPTAPKPAKAAAGLQSGSASPSPSPSPARQPPAALAKPASMPPSLSASPAKPPSPVAPALHVPAKPPRAAAAAAAAAGPPAAPEGASPGDSAQQKLEETSACLAAALQAVEEKIRQEDAQGPR